MRLCLYSINKDNSYIVIYYNVIFRVSIKYKYVVFSYLKGLVLDNLDIIIELVS